MIVSVGNDLYYRNVSMRRCFFKNSDYNKKILLAIETKRLKLWERIFEIFCLYDKLFFIQIKLNWCHIMNCNGNDLYFRFNLEVYYRFI